MRDRAAPEARVLRADDLDTVPTTVWPGSVSCSPPVSAARSRITDPGPMLATPAAVIRVGAARPGIAAVVMITSRLAAFASIASRTCWFSSSVRGRA